MDAAIVHRWSVETANEVYHASFDDNTGVFDVTRAAKVLKLAGKELLDKHTRSMLVLGDDKSIFPGGIR